MSKAQKLTGNLSQRKGRENLSSITCHLSLKKRGSALLIVLGMFAFMLVSAVAFSVYMRASRAPSSYLLRNTSMRQVVKAAVARAIDEVDTAIGNDPFPGVGYNHDYGGNGINQSDRYKNDNWHGRVFVPSNEVAMVDTVSTLTLEGLGYLPPCLVNEVRYWSRHTRTAKWRAFNYGLGRYAFTAVNVSDFFDLNNFITPASGERRPYLNRSSSPHGRVSPTYLFRSGNESAMNSGGGAASAFLTAIATGSGIGNDPPVAQVPFVSLMDFNLSLMNNPLGGFATPFGRLIKENNGSTFLSGMEDAARRTVYMAGGWNGGSNLTWNAYQTTGRINLKYPECQPFAGRTWVTDGSANLTKCINDVRTPFWLTIEPYIYPLTVALMCDYLDCDSVPVSLCIPSAEATPMLCGVNLNKCISCALQYELGPENDVGSDAAPKKMREDVCSMNVTIDIDPTVAFVYPFLSGGASDSFSVECYARIFFRDESALPANTKVLRNPLFLLEDNVLDDLKNFGDSANNKKSYIEVKCDCKSIELPSPSGNDEQREKSMVGQVGRGFQKTIKVDLAKLTFVKEGESDWKFDKAEDLKQIDFYQNKFDGDFEKLDESERVDFAQTFSDESGAVSYRPSVALWVLIKDNKSGQIVDMAPAIPAYDRLRGSPENKNDVGIEFNRPTGASAGAPALRFIAQQSGDGIRPDRGVFNAANKDNLPTVSPDWEYASYAVNDPRYNWAPEHWYAQKTGNPKDFWFDNVKNFRENVGKDWCDPDIFMSVSDQGYLQSMYEFMMLPQIGSMITKEGMDCGALDNADYDGKVRTSAADVVCNGLMWRTYRAEAFRKESGTWDIGYLERMPFEEADNGLRVNPYTDNTNVMFGAFANMPLDWAGAGTNWNNNGMADKDYMKPESGDFKGTDDYIFDWSYKYQDVYAMASFWMGLFRRTAEPTEREELYGADAWQDVFDDHKVVYWRTGEVREEPPGVDVNRVEQILNKEMTSVDRKYLYGFLRGCFANTAQLFLVFVRAETTAGGAVGAGARAVALVWRDPAPPMDNAGNFVKATGGSENPHYGKDNARKYLRPISDNGPEESWRFQPREYPPHRTRILFYHQFD